MMLTPRAKVLDALSNREAAKLRLKIFERICQLRPSDEMISILALSDKAAAWIMSGTLLVDTRNVERIRE
jgi:hypothetical protein